MHCILFVCVDNKVMVYHSSFILVCECKLSKTKIVGKQYILIYMFGAQGCIILTLEIRLMAQINPSELSIVLEGVV